MSSTYSDEYTKQLEAENEELRDQLAKAQQEVESFKKKCIDPELNPLKKLYKPLDVELHNGFQLYSIDRSYGSGSLKFHCVKYTRSWLRRPKTFNLHFSASIVFTNNNSFSVSYHDYPSGCRLYESKDEKFCNFMLNVARQNGFIYIGLDKSNNSEITPYARIRHPTMSGVFCKKFLDDGYIVKEEE